MKALKIFLPVTILMVALVGTWALISARAEVGAPPREPEPPMVRVITVEKRNLTLRVSAQGAVQPRQETLLSARVAAEVVEVSPRFEIGSFVAKGEVLLRQDERDLDPVVKQIEAQIAQARRRLEEEKAEARLAERDWQRFGAGEPTSLKRREPQIAEALASLNAAEAQLSAARLDRDRTRIRAPFAGRIREKMVEVGQFLAPGQPVVRLHSVDVAEIRLPMSLDQLRLLDFPQLPRGRFPQPGPAVLIKADLAGRQAQWSGQLVRSEGEVDPRNQMLYLVAQVEDPYGLRQTDERASLPIGLFVAAEIIGRTVENAILVPSQAFWQPDRVMVVDDQDRLFLRQVELLSRNSEVAILTAGLEDGEKICASPPRTFSDGMRIRPVEEPWEPSAVTLAALAAVAPTAVASPESTEPTTSLASAEHHTELIDLLDIQVANHEDRLEVHLTFSDTPEYRTLSLQDPERFVVDLLAVRSRVPAEIQVAVDSVSAVRVGQFKSSPRSITRVVLDLVAPASPRISSSSSGLTISLPEQAEPAAEAP